MFLNKLSLLLLTGCILGCSQPSKETAVSKKTNLVLGDWRMEMNLKGHILPFQFSLDTIGSKYQLTIKNAEERIITDEIERKKDSFFIKLPVFDSEFKLSILDSKSLKGDWINYYKGDDYKISVSAYQGTFSRFVGQSKKVVNLNASKYQVTFNPNGDDPSNAIGIFKQDGGRITGTFATETGDYRYLEGNVIGDSVFLSTFDGSHAFLFEAAIKDSSLSGMFYSGTHFSEPWTAVANNAVSLRDPNTLTYLKEGYNALSFSLPNANGDIISLSDKTYENKAVIVQIMGSWCPNCLDETNYLSSLYNKYNKEGLEVVALAFERTKTKQKAINNLKRLVEKTGANYELLLGGATREDKATDVLPMLNHVMSYPTAIFIDKAGKIRRIHTGFYGPSTGSYYTDFVDETEALVQTMLNETF